ncbi:hypothetical protein [Acidocella sp.]|uniref:hypothetical protein n=1 Tax=Acidocella sp. TaxID=50710 RepID=UPI00260544E6|nr:hypothetical protein [Acidocella sp.]
MDSLFKDILLPIIVALITSFVTIRINDRQIQIDNITKERAKWRDKIRAMLVETHKAWETADIQKIKELKSTFAVYLNPFDTEDEGILTALEKLINDREDPAILEFYIRISLLLKHDWERAKFESKPWAPRIICGILTMKCQMHNIQKCRLNGWFCPPQRETYSNFKNWIQTKN